MDWSDAVTPLLIAAIGVIAVAIGSWVSARSALRVRLIDTVREDARDHRDFQVRAVAAVNALGTSTAHLIRARLSFLEAQREEARAFLEASDTPSTVTFEGPFNLSPAEDARVAAATVEWRNVLAEGHAFASPETGQALQAFDERRAELVTAVNVATTASDISDSIRGLEAADAACEDLRQHYARQIYRNLQVEKVAGSSRVFQIAHMRKLRTFAKKVTAMQDRDIADARKLITRTEIEHDQAGR